MNPELYNYFHRRENLKDDPRKGIIFAIVNNEGELLLERRLNGVAEGLLIVPGGRRKVDESKDFALMGELLEECGVLPSKYKFLEDIMEINLPNSDIEELAVFLVQDYEGVLENKERKSIHMWVNLELADSVCDHEVSRQILRIVRDALNENN